jgi:hypothetical protein
MEDTTTNQPTNQPTRNAQGVLMGAVSGPGISMYHCCARVPMGAALLAGIVADVDMRILAVSNIDDI